MPGLAGCRRPQQVRSASRICHARVWITSGMDNLRQGHYTRPYIFRVPEGDRLRNIPGMPGPSAGTSGPLPCRGTEWRQPPQAFPRTSPNGIPGTLRRIARFGPCSGARSKQQCRMIPWSHPAFDYSMTTDDRGHLSMSRHFSTAMEHGPCLSRQGTVKALYPRPGFERGTLPVRRGAQHMN